jgi:hypothetical protein
MVVAEQAGIAFGAGPRSYRWLEPALAFFAGILFYMSLYGELPYHDVARFIAQIEGGKFIWDMGHVWLQPVTLLWHWYVGFGESAEQSQKHINTVFAAAGLAVFYSMLIRFERPLWQRIVATALVAASCNILTLAPTGAVKPLALPFLTGSFYAAAVWERDQAQGRLRNGVLVLSGALMALAACLHSSCLAAPPFVGLAVLAATLRRGEGWVNGIFRSCLYGLTVGLLYLLSIEIARLVFFGEWLALHDFAATVGEKNDLLTGFFSWSDLAGRMVFGTVNNFIAAPGMGPVMRAWLLNQIPSLAPYARMLLFQATPWFATLALLATIYLRGAWLAARGRGLAMPLAFVAGSLAWNVFFNINEPEHWFHLTVPTIFLALFVFERGTLRWLLPVWAVSTITLNLTLWALPEARYPLKQYELQLQRDYGSDDLFLYFIAYGGGPNLSFFELATPQLALDQLYEKERDKGVFFAQVSRNVDSALARGGRVVVFQALDPENWNAPWMLLTRGGLTKSELTGFFYSHYRVEDLGEIAGMKAWRLLSVAPIQ